MVFEAGNGKSSKTRPSTAGRRPSTCGHQRSVMSTAAINSVSTTQPRGRRDLEGRRPGGGDAGVVGMGSRAASAAAKVSHGHARPHTATCPSRTPPGTGLAGTRLEQVLRRSRYAAPRDQPSFEADGTGWMEAWISAALEAQQIQNEAFPLNETHDEDDWSAAVDPGAGDPSGLGACKAEPFAATHYDAGATKKLPTSCTREVSSVSLSRPRTASVHTKHSTLKLGCHAHVTALRPQSAVVARERPGSTRWAGATYNARTEIGGRSTPCRPSGLGRASTSSSKGGKRQSSTRDCYRRDGRQKVEAAWSYTAPQKPDNNSPRQILVKVPCVKANGKGRRGRVAYRIAWNGDVNGDDLDADGVRGGDIARDARTKPADPKAEATATTNMSPRCRAQTTAVVQLPCPLVREEGSLTTCGNSSCLAPGSRSVPHPLVDAKPRTGGVIAQLRASVAREQHPSASNSVAPSTTSFLLSPASGDNRAACSAPDSPISGSHGGRPKGRPQSAVGTNASSEPLGLTVLYSRTGEGEMTSGGRGAGESSHGSTSSRLGNEADGAAGRSAYTWLPRSARTVGGKRRRDMRAPTEYDFFPSASFPAKHGEYVGYWWR